MFQVYDDLLFKPAWTVLDRIAPHVRNSKTKLTIGPGVTNPFHYHPAIIAAYISYLNQETKGKAFLMIGRGAFHDVVGLSIKRPMRALREAIIVIDSLIQGKSASFNGEQFSLTSEAKFRWTPPKGWDSSRNSKAKRIPIWIGTWGPKTCQIAGGMRQVTGVMVSSVLDPRYIALLRKNLELGATRSSRDAKSLELGLVSGTVVSRNRDLAFKLARESLAPYLPYLIPMTEFVGIDKAEVEGVREALANRDLKLATSLVSEKSVNAFKPWGTPDDIIEQVSRLMKSGLTRFNFGFGRGPEDLEGIKLLGTKVLPYFQNR